MAAMLAGNNRTFIRFFDLSKKPGLRQEILYSFTFFLEKKGNHPECFGDKQIRCGDFPIAHNFLLENLLL